MRYILIGRLARMAAVSALVLVIGDAALAQSGKVAEIQADDRELAAPAHESGGLFGSYLSGRIAQSEKDTEAAARFYREALERDPGNAAILEQAFQLEVATGNREQARRLALRLVKEQPHHAVARFLLGIEDFRRADYKSAERHFRMGGKGALSEFVSILARAWVQVARGDTKGALASVSKLTKEEWAFFFEQYHTALIADIAGQDKLSRAAYARAFKKNPRNPRLIEAYARHAVTWNDKGLAEKLLSPLVARAVPHPVAKALLADITAGTKPGFAVATPLDGLAEVFYGVGEALAGDSGGAEIGLNYLQLALFAKPDYAGARYALGELYEAQKSYHLAIKALDSLPEDSPLWFNGKIRKAFNLHTLEKVEDAKTLLKQLLEKDPENLQILQAMGTILRNEKKYDEAIAYYTRAINAVPAPDKRHWALFYHRGIAYERSKQWPKAEADFKRSLELDGEQASVLNYLGYSWVDQNMNIDEAMELIKKAVKLKPDDGYYVDSLGWAYYRLRDYPRAVEHLERAVELQPQDPIINDHLGDAYWRVGRRLEAVYQWSLAMSLEPEPEDAAVIRRKLALARANNNLGVVAILNQDWTLRISNARRAFARVLARQGRAEN